MEVLSTQTNSELLQLLDCSYSDLTNVGTFRQTAGVLQQCNLMISNDSGLMHAANAVRTPIVGIFGPTSFVKSYPRGSVGRVRVVHNSSPCAPCYNWDPSAPNRCQDRICLTELSVDHVIRAASEIIRYPQELCVKR